MKWSAGSYGITSLRFQAIRTTKVTCEHFGFELSKNETFATICKEISFKPGFDYWHSISNKLYMRTPLQTYKCQFKHRMNTIEKTIKESSKELKCTITCRSWCIYLLCKTVLSTSTCWRNIHNFPNCNSFSCRTLNN